MSQRTNISTLCFGPPLWTFLHLLSFSYPDKLNLSDINDVRLKNNTYNFLMYLGYILPCNICRDHYKEHFYNTNVYNQLNTKEDFIKWVYTLHDIVNKSLGKTSPPLDEVYTKYNSLIGQGDNIVSKNESEIPSDDDDDKIHEKKSGVCDKSCHSSDYMCKIEFIKAAYPQYKETFNNSNPIYTNIYLIYIIICLLIIIILGFNS